MLFRHVREVVNMAFESLLLHANRVEEARISLSTTGYKYKHLFHQVALRNEVSDTLTPNISTKLPGSLSLRPWYSIFAPTVASTVPHISERACIEMSLSMLLRMNEVTWQRPIGTGMYAAVSADLFRSARDAIEALSLFQRLALSDGTAPSSPPGSWLDFDAHPGDCSCQIRTAGMHLIASSFRASPVEARKKVHETLTTLRNIEKVALETFHQLCSLNTPPSKIGKGLATKRMPFERFLDAIGVGACLQKMFKDENWIQLLPFGLSLEEEESASEHPIVSRATSNGSRQSSCETGVSSCDGLPIRHADPQKGCKAFDPSTSPRQPEFRFRPRSWQFAVRWIVACYCIGRFREEYAAKDGKSIKCRIAIPVSCV